MAHGVHTSRSYFVFLNLVLKPVWLFASRLWTTGSVSGLAFITAPVLTYLFRGRDAAITMNERQKQKSRRNEFLADAVRSAMTATAELLVLCSVRRRHWPRSPSWWRSVRPTSASFCQILPPISSALWRPVTCWSRSRKALVRKKYAG